MARTRDQLVQELTAPGGPFEIVEKPVRGVPLRVYTMPPRTLRDVVMSMEQHADRDYLVYRGERWTFGDGLRIIAGLATHLREQYGVRRGDRVAIAMRNYPEWPFAFWACQVLGAVAVPLNAWWTGPELAYALGDSGAVALFADGERVERLQPERAGLPQLRHVVCVRGDTAHSDTHPWQDVLDALDPGATLPDPDIDTDDDATIMYTSGTTGVPKGAIATHRNHCTNLLNTALLGAVNAVLAAPDGAAPQAPAAPAQPASLQTFPLFHIGGLTGLYVNTAFGGKIVLQYKWDTAEALDLIEQEGITGLALVPTLLRRLLESPEIEKRDLSTLGGISSGGAPVPADLITRIESDFERKVAPANGYGLTETTSAVIVNAADMYFAHPDSIGRPVPGTDVRVVEPGGGDVPTGEVGELWVRGPNVVRGYWNKPEATAEAFTDGWFHTGDLGYVDADGFVYVVDRLKDVVLRGGENVYCAEVEAVLYQHPAVYDAAVIGVPHPSLGEEVAAVVQPRPGSDLGADEVRRYAAQHLAAFKVPAHVFVQREDLPRNAAGKVLKRELRERVTQPAGLTPGA